MERLIQEATQGLQGSSEEELKNVLVILGFKEEVVSKARSRGRLGLLRLVNRHLFSDELAEEPDQGQSTWKKVAEVCRAGGASIEQDLKDVAPPSAAQEVESQVPQPGRSAVVKQPESQWRREFKISGQIGEAGQNERLSYTSLIHQMQRGKSRGNTDEEITEAVIRAMAPGLTLRAYLESKPELDLPTLRRLLRSHYQEKEATELYHDLSKAAQKTKETPHDFILRLLALRQNIIFSSQEAGSAFNYNKELVQNMFLHSVLTGISSESIKNDLKPLLSDPEISDEMLLERVNIAAHNETERQDKHRRTKTHVNVLQEVPEEKTKGTTQLDMKQIHQEIKALIRAEVNALKETGAHMGNNRQGYRRRSPDEWGCEECRKKGEGRQCRHCFRCGSLGHLAKGCWGNDRRAPLWDGSCPPNVNNQ